METLESSEINMSEGYFSLISIWNGILEMTYYWIVFFFFMVVAMKENF